jgi:hypothetical protein
VPTPTRIDIFRLNRGELVLVSAPSFGGLFVVDAVAPPGHPDEVVVLPAADLAVNRHRWATAAQILAVFAPKAGDAAAKLPTAVARPEDIYDPAARKRERLDALRAAEAVIPRAAIVVPPDETKPVEITRRHVTRRYMPVDGLIFMPEPDAFGFVEASGSPYAPAAVVAAWRERHSEEPPPTEITEAM